MNDIIFSNELNNIWDLIQQDSSSNSLLFSNTNHTNGDETTHLFVDDFINNKQHSSTLDSNTHTNADLFINNDLLLDTHKHTHDLSPASSSSLSFNQSSSFSGAIPTFFSQQSSSVNSPAASFESLTSDLDNKTSSIASSMCLNNDLNNLAIREESMHASETKKPSKKRKRKKSESDEMIQVSGGGGDKYEANNLDSQSLLSSSSNQSGFCRICSDKASGFHYGISSCEGCKGFFRRSIQKQMNYKCVNDGCCVISLANRNKCQHCRFKKCLDMGMSRECVRFSKTPSATNTSQINSNTNSNSSSNFNTNNNNNNNNNQKLILHNNNNNLKLELLDLILIVAQSHEMNCPYTKRKREHLKLQNRIEIDLSDRDELWRIYANLVTNDISAIVEFAKRIPKFSSLESEDKIVLIKSNIFKIWLCRISAMFEESINGHLQFESGYLLTKQQMSIVFGDDLTSRLFKFSKLLNQFKLNDIEIGLYSACVLTTIDINLNFNNVKTINHLHKELKDAFKLEILQNKNESESDLFDKLDTLTQDLNEINQKFNLILTHYRLKKLKLPTIFSEIYELPNDA